MGKIEKKEKKSNAEKRVEKAMDLIKSTYDLGNRHSYCDQNFG